MLVGLPLTHFAVILVDWPQRFATYNEKGRGRCPDWKRFKGSPARHYETLSFNEAMTLRLGDHAAPNCVLFFWVTGPLLCGRKAQGKRPAEPRPDEIMEAWGFEYKSTGFVWGKVTRDGRPPIGNGYWTRAGGEICLLGIRGKPKRLNKDVRQLIIEPRREHSRKPDRIHTDIERLVAGPYLEVFSRARREGWVCVGDQVDRFPTTETPK
jgi:N6-adenosine-specific RNA methylase IME4